MKEMFYVIRFEPELDLGDIDCYLKEIESHIRLEVGDKISLSFLSFNMDLEDNLANITIMKDLLLEKSIYASKYRASFEISDIIYNHDYNGEDKVNFHGVIILKGK